ncbi:MAG: hypothetical protein HOK58_01050 [Acidimicrobiaceae bacterium]|nr:hypothetical protein [Acidimicrobiaceae bacterium]
MSSSKTKSKKLKGHPSARFEYRVWGEYRTARKLIRKLADSEIREELEDCYLLVDDETFNAKIRDNTLKVKQLIAEDKGFERWVSDKYRSADSTPSPFDVVYEALDLDRLRKEKRFKLTDALKGLDADSGVRVVFVTKQRRRYFIGDLKAEVTDVKIAETGEIVRTLSIEGDDLQELVKLRKKLGLKGEPNTSMAQFIDPEVETESA